MVFQYGEFILMLRHFQLQCGLQARQNVIRYFECGLIAVHGDGGAEFLMRMNLYAGNDGLDIATVIQQRRERGPAFLIHSIAFIKDTDAALDHRSDQRRRMVGNFS